MSQPVILIYPQQNLQSGSPPNGILTIAASLEHAGFQVKIVDFQIESPNISELLALNPLYIGIYCGTSNYPHVIQIARTIKESSQIVIVLGGPHATFMDREILQKEQVIDYIIRYECEEPMVQFTIALAHQENLGQVKNLTYRKNKEVVRTPLALPRSDLNSLPLPARHLVDLNRYPPVTRGSMITSRGCPHSCLFCASRFFHGGNFRAHTPERVFKEMEILYHRYNVDYVTFFDDFFTADFERTTKLCHFLIASEIPIFWGCETRIDAVDRKLMQLMYNAGCRYLFFGIESGHQVTLNTIAKGISITNAEEVVISAKEIGIKVKISLMIGLPSDTCDTVIQSIEFVKKLNPNYLAPLITTPFPGTPLWKDPEKFGITIIDNDLTHYDYLHPVIETKYLKADDIQSLYMEALSYNLESADLDIVK